MPTLPTQNDGRIFAAIRSSIKRRSHLSAILPEWWFQHGFVDVQQNNMLAKRHSSLSSTTHDESTAARTAYTAVSLLCMFVLASMLGKSL